MRALHRHCVCNGVWLCATCHKDVHTHPFEAKAEGFIVSRHVDDPSVMPVKAWYGTVLLDCKGFFTHIGSDSELAEAEGD